MFSRALPNRDREGVGALRRFSHSFRARSFSDDEERWITMGLDGLGRVLVVVHSWRGESVRRISARKATPREHRRYEEAK
jgi:uncharacterized DUF497 family protein